MILEALEQVENMLLTCFDSAVPAHIAELFTKTAEVEITSDYEHAPHLLIDFLYGGSERHIALMALNTASPISFRQGERAMVVDPRLFDKLMGA